MVESAAPSPTNTLHDSGSMTHDSPANGPHDEEAQVARDSRSSHRPDKGDGIGATQGGPREQQESSKEKDGEEWIVKWKGPDDPGCPLNTPKWRKWCVLARTAMVRLVLKMNAS